MDRRRGRAHLFSAFDDFARALREAGAEVTGVGYTPESRLRMALRKNLDRWLQVRSPFDGDEVARRLRESSRGRLPDRLETVDERLIEPAAVARRRLGLPGLSVESARLCRDKPAMKAALRQAGLPCAESIGVERLEEIHRFAERVGYPLIVKPRAGLGAQKTFRANDRAQLDRAAKEFALDVGGAAAVEEYIDGHEGFYDTLSVAGEPRLDFISHYYPTVIEALGDRSIAPQVAATNRVEMPSYGELRRIGRQVVRALGIGTSPTHMEWFFGSKGLKISEIGARPPGERIWDLYCRGNDLDLYRVWAENVLERTVSRRPSRRLATGSVQVRPDRDGRVASYRGLAAVRARCGRSIWQHALPRNGRPTVALEKGYLTNAWFRLEHRDYDELRRMMDFIGQTLKVHARPA